jgi:hypothetical protein
VKLAKKALDNYIFHFEEKFGKKLHSFSAPEKDMFISGFQAAKTCFEDNYSANQCNDLLKECSEFINWLFTHGGAWSPSEESDEVNIRFTNPEIIYYDDQIISLKEKLDSILAQSQHIIKDLGDIEFNDGMDD